MKHRLAAVVLAGLAAAGVLVLTGEAALRWKLGPPRAPALLSDFDYMYSDIYMSFFKKTPQRDGTSLYRSQKPRAAPQEFQEPKPAGLTRIFVVGGSVAAPFHDPRTSHLGEFLERVLPGRRFEVIGCGMGGYDSYRESLVQAEVLGHEPDLVVLLSGNNEYYDPVRVDPVRYKLNAYLSRFWFARLIQGRLDLRNKIPYWSPDPYRSPEQRRSDFEANLRSMVQRARAKGVAMVLCTLPANIRDIPSTRPRPVEWDSGYLRAWAAVDRGDFKAAAVGFRSYVRSHPRDSIGHYWLGKSLEGLGRPREAAAAYWEALDWDNPPERCGPRMNETIRSVARQEDAILADLERGFEGLVPDGLLDGRLFVDQVHWRREYYPFVSALIVDALYQHDRSGAAPVLAPPDLWDIGSLAKVEPSLRKPVITPESEREYAKRSLFTAMTFVINDDERGVLISEPGVAQLAVCAATHPDVFAFYLRVLPVVQAEFGRSVWTRLLKSPAAHWPSILAHAGEACRRLKRYREALGLLAEALRLDPANDRALFFRALTYAAMGQRAKSQDDARKLSPDTRRRPEVAVLLKDL